MISWLTNRTGRRKKYLKARYFAYTTYDKFKAVLNRAPRYDAVYNVNQADELSYSKRALLIYLVKPFLLNTDDSQLLTHQNSRQCKQIAELLDDFGYIVDAIDIRHRHFVPVNDYDIIISNRADLRGMDSYFRQDAVKIFLASVKSHPQHNSSLRHRHERLSQRRGCNVQMRRVYPEVVPYVKNSQAIIGFGNDPIAKTWREVFQGPIYPFNNYGFKETPYFIDKDFTSARHDFLFLASGSQMQKGLDLLLEIFPKLPHLHLYICSNFKQERDFCACYEKELYQTRNIHPVGWIQVNSPEYDQLVRTCAYIIMPTCSEGQSGSVVQCMYSGLIPLVTKQAGIDTEDFGVTFASDDLDDIERVIREVAELPDSWHRARSVHTRRISEQKYSETAFVNRWREILSELLEHSHVGLGRFHTTRR